MRMENSREMQKWLFPSIEFVAEAIESRVRVSATEEGEEEEKV